MKRNLILIVLLVSCIFAGRIDLIVSAREEMQASKSMVCRSDANNECDGRQSEIDNDGWMAFGLAVHEIGFQGATSAKNEKTHESNDGGHSEIGKKIASEVRKKFWISKLASKAISAKKVITYYVFGLCKMLD